MVNFSWENAMRAADKKLTENIKIYEKQGMGKKAMLAKEKQLELKKRIKDTFA